MGSLYQKVKRSTTKEVTMNQLTIYGNLGKDPESQTSQKGNAFWVLNVAEHIRCKNKEDDTCWWRVVIFRSGLDGIIKSLKKGSAVIVYGEMNPPRIFESEDGEPRVALSCTGYSVYFSPFGMGTKDKEQEPNTSKEEKSDFSENLSNIFEAKEDHCPF